MRIAISGCQNSGKSTLIKNFLYTWKGYKTPEKTYRDILKEKNLSHSSSTTVETQEAILNSMIDQLQSYDKNSKVIFDRCPIDNVVYSIWAFEKGIEGFTHEFIQKQILLMKESLRFIDVIFISRFDERQSIVADELRDTNKVFIQEIDSIFGSVYRQYIGNIHADVFFPKDDSPGVIQLPHNPQARIDLIAEYVTPDGEMYSDEDSILNPNNINELEALVKQQKTALDQEEAEKALFKKFGLKS